MANGVSTSSCRECFMAETRSHPLVKPHAVVSGFMKSSHGAGGISLSPPGAPSG